MFVTGCVDCLRDALLFELNGPVGGYVFAYWEMCIHGVESMGDMSGCIRPLDVKGSI